LPRSLSPVILFLFCLLFLPCMAVAQDWMQVRGVIHLQTRFDGSGRYSIDQLVSMAGEKGLEVLIPTDHDLQVMEYGVFPFRNLIKKREERDSVISLGPGKYLADIRRVNQRQSDVVVVPGVQSSPFYYWTGSPFKKNLTAHNYRKELLVIGMAHPDDYLGLPLLHGRLSTRYTRSLLPQSAVFLAAFFLALYLVFQKGMWRTVGAVVGLFSLLMVINHHPFRSSRFDPYHGDRGIKPFQELIDYVEERGGLTFWSHPESNYAVNGVALGSVTLKTPHYAGTLVASTGFTGFEALYGDTITATDPGRQWDLILNAYCDGSRIRPAWGIAGADFRAEKGKGGAVDLDRYQTVFLVARKRPEDILDALRSGRVYAVVKGKESSLSLERFQVLDDQTEAAAGMGGELNVKGTPVVTAKLSARDNGTYPAEIRLIRGGKVVETFKGETPLAFRYRDPKGGSTKTFYRLAAVSGPAGKLLSNPVFVLKK